MAAYEAVQKALALASGATEGGQAYIHALAKRYSSDPKVDLRKLDADYARAMRDVYQSYPDDLDTATLYAKSLMDLMLAPGAGNARTNIVAEIGEDQNECLPRPTPDNNPP